MVRKDLRADDQSRHVNISLGGVVEADGAAKIVIGETCVLATVCGPAQPRYSRHEDAEKAKIEVEVNMACDHGLNSNDLIIAEYIKNVISACVTLEDFPRLLFVFKVLVIRNDGSLLSASLNACTLALLDAGIPMNFFITCVEIAHAGHQLLYDPTQSEEHQSDAVVSVAFATLNKYDGTMVNYSKVVGLEVQGNLSITALSTVLNEAEKCGNALSSTFRNAVESKLLNTRFSVKDVV